MNFNTDPFRPDYLLLNDYESNPAADTMTFNSFPPMNFCEVVFLSTALKEVKWNQHPESFLYLAEVLEAVIS